MTKTSDEKFGSAIKRALDRPRRYTLQDREQALDELQKFQELREAAEKWEEYENSRTSYPRLRAALAATRERQT